MTLESHRSRFALTALLVVAVAVVAVVATGARRTTDSRTGVAVGAAFDGVDTTTAAAPAPSPSVRLRTQTLPIPDALPSNPYEDTPAETVGHIEIPKLGVDADLQKGVSLTAINRGPGWWPHTAMPGELGNVVVAGHRTTYSKPFAHLDDLEPGDQVIFTTSAGRFVYQVRGVIVVPGDWIDIAAQSRAHTATLFACHPPGSARERIVAKLALVGADGQPVDDESALPPLDAEEQRTEHTLIVRVPPGGSVGQGDPFSGSDGG